MYDDSTTLYNNIASGNLGTDSYFISLNANNSWDDKGAYINFPNFNVLNDQVASLIDGLGALQSQVATLLTL